MNTENNEPSVIEPVIPHHKADALPSECDRIVEHSQSASELPTAEGRPHGLRRPLFVITGVALCMGLVSCIVPYDTQGGVSVTGTSYRPGYRVNSLPGGYRSETITGSTYYYHDGYYYRQGSGDYVVVDAPRSSRYYEDYSRHQQTHQSNRDNRESYNRHDQRYERDEVITRLPDGYRVVKHRGNTYYLAGDRYYRRLGDTYVNTSSPY